MVQGKKFISPGAWFSLIYPSDWNEFEDGEGSFLFYNPNTWTGNFRISAYKDDPTTRNGKEYGKEAVQIELKENPSSKRVKIGNLECAYSKEMFQEEGAHENTVEAVLKGVRHIREQAGNLVIVTNEIFSEAADYQGETELYQEYLGQINQKIAEIADQVVEVVYGIPVYHKNKLLSGEG